ncbi:hypothetical protein PG987_004918 [Apiospora arundinis]
MPEIKKTPKLSSASQRVQRRARKAVLRAKGSTGPLSPDEQAELERLKEKADDMDIDSDNDEDDGTDDVKLNDPVLARIQQEFDSENPNYYTLFGLAPPKGSEEPLDTESQGQLKQRGTEYLATVDMSNVPKKTEWLEYLEAYLDKADDPNKTPEELANENYEPLDRFNDKLVTDYGEEYGREHALPYSYLKAKLREVSGLEKRIETAGDADKEKLSRELETLQRTIQGYLVKRNLPGNWASLLHTPPPPANFDTSIDSKWDHCYSKYPKSKNGDRIFIAWKGKSNAVSDKTDKIFLMTPQGLLCEDIGAPDSEEHNFMTEHPEYEYLKSVHHYEKADISGIQDAWSKGGGSEKGYPTIYCLLQFKGTNVFRVASRSTAICYQKGFGDSAIAICEGKGIIFEKPHSETGTSKKTHGKKEVGTRVWTDDDKTHLKKQLEDTEVLRLRTQVEELAERLNKVLGTFKAPVMAQ